MYQPLDFSGASYGDFIPPNGFPSIDILGEQGEERVYGNEGDDSIWASLCNTGVGRKILGNNGDDNLYGAHHVNVFDDTGKLYGNSLFAGGADKDLIDMTFWNDNPDLIAFLAPDYDAEDVRSNGKHYGDS